jgi:hypothetical protein
MITETETSMREAERAKGRRSHAKVSAVTREGKKVLVESVAAFFTVLVSLYPRYDWVSKKLWGSVLPLVITGQRGVPNSQCQY